MTVPTDVDQLRLPEHWRTEREYTRDQMLDRSLTVDVGWWNSQLARLTLPGGPVTGVDGAGNVVDTGVAGISRRAVQALDPALPDAALRRLWHALAWGTGTKPRQCLRRMHAVSASQAFATALLEKASTAAHHDPVGAYRLLLPGRSNAIKYLGAAFFTKYLYFTPDPAPTRQALILDDRVADALRVNHGWSTLRTGGYWPADTYARYCRLVHRWAAEASVVQRREVWPDEIEEWLFTTGAAPAARRARTADRRHRRALPDRLPNFQPDVRRGGDRSYLR